MSDIVTWPYVLRRGHFDDPSQGACAMDAVNWLAHGRHGDAPECVCPVIRAYVVAGNDAMPDDTRQRLLPFLHRIAGSRSEASEADRLRVFVLGAARVFLPRALDAAGLKTKAARLRALHNDVSYEIIEKTARLSWKTLGVTQNTMTLQAVQKVARAELSARTAMWGAMWGAKLSAQAAVRVAESSAQVWDNYFTVLDVALRAGPEGAPWSADTADLGARLYDGAGGLKTVYSEGVTG